MKRFKVVVLARLGNAKYTYSNGRFASMQEAIQYHEINGGRVIECKELGVRFKKPASE